MSAEFDYLLHRPFEGDYRRTQAFGVNHDYYFAEYGQLGHNGEDYATPVGAKALAMQPGTAVCVDEGAKGFGKYVYVVGYEGDTLQAHLSEFKAQTGQEVWPGDLVGLTGNTGNSTGPHIHVGWRPRPMKLNNGYRGYAPCHERIIWQEHNVLCPHVHVPGLAGKLPGQMQTLRDHVRWVCVMDPPRQRNNPYPYQNVIGRIWDDDWEREHIPWGTEGGYLWYLRMASRWDQSPYVRVWRGPNEPPVITGVQRGQLTAFYRGLYEGKTKAHDPRQIAGPELSVGWPGGWCGDKPNWWEFIISDAREMLDLYRSVDYISGHHYGRRNGTEWTGWDDWTLRFKYVLGAFRQYAPELLDKPWLITEGGLDIAGDKNTSGWAAQGGPTTRIYADWLYTCNRRLIQYPQIEACCIFTNATPDWNSFRSEAVWTVLEQDLPNYYGPVSQPSPPADVLRTTIDHALTAAEVPVVKENALYKAAIAHWPGCAAKSDEVEVSIGQVAYVGQRFYDPNTLTEYSLYTVKGDWNPANFVVWSQEA